jgi:hypothetical protein
LVTDLSMVYHYSSRFTIMFLFLPGTLNRTRNFHAHDPYHPYHPYLNLEWSTSVGKGGKGRKDDIVKVSEHLRVS